MLAFLEVKAIPTRHTHPFNPYRQLNSLAHFADLIPHSSPQSSTSPSVTISHRSSKSYLDSALLGGAGTPRMPSRKRGRAEMESSAEPAQSPQDENMLARLRNMWEFSNLMQYIFIFGKAVKIDDDFDIEVRQVLTNAPSHD